MAEAWDVLPDEVVVHIFSLLHPVQDTASVTSVCRRWHSLHQDPALWHRFHATYFGGSPSTRALPKLARRAIECGDGWREAFAVKHTQLLETEKAAAKLALAAGWGSDVLMRRVLKEGDREKWRLRDLRWVFDVACAAGSRSCVQVLLHHRGSHKMLKPLPYPADRHPLSWALDGGSLELLQFLLSQGAMLPYQGQHCRPLMEACRTHPLGVVKLLLEHDPDLPSHATRATEAALEQDREEVVRLVQAHSHVHFPFRHFLLLFKMDPSATSKPVPSVGTLQALCDGGMKLERAHHWTLLTDTWPMRLMSDKGWCRFLVNNGVDVNMRYLDMTPLHWAVREGHEGMVACLLAHGADTAAKNKEGLTAAQLAQQYIYNQDITDLFKKAMRKKRRRTNGRGGAQKNK